MRNIYIKDIKTKIYYFKKNVHADLIDYFPQQVHYIKTLQTRNKAIAVNRAKILNAKYMYLKRNYKNMTIKEIEKIANKLVDYNFDVAENDLYNSPKPEDTLFNLTLDNTIEELQIQLQQQNFTYVQKEINIATSKIILNDNDKIVLQELLMQNTIEALKTIRMNINDNLYIKPRISNKTTIKEQLSGHKLSDVVDTYLKNTKNKNSWTDNILNGQKHSLNIMLNFFGHDKNIMEISRDDIFELVDIFTKLPQKFSQMNIFKDKSLDYIVNHENTIKKLSVNSINKHIQIVAGVFQYAYLNNLIDRNICIDVKLKIDKFDAYKNKKIIFNDDEIIHMSTLISKESIEKYMIFKIAKFTGMRLNEICQLTKNDIREIDNVLCFNINVEDDKKIKNVNSIRRVPIHSKLVEELKTYIESRTKNKLFDMTSSQYSTFFAKKIKYIATTDKRKTFHCIRHNFANELVQVDVRKEHVASLMGHVQENEMTMTTYAEKINVKLLKDQIEKIY